MKIIYLGAYKANHPNRDIIYQDINGKRDMIEIYKMFYPKLTKKGD